MTHAEYTELAHIVTGKPFEVRPRMQEFLKTVVVTNKPTRTSSQNKSLHLWFSQISEICQNQGVTWNMLIKHTVDVAVLPDGVKNFWKVLQKALYNTDSTTELKKTGQIDRMVEHFALFMGKEGVEVPPFPHDEKKAIEEMSGYKTNAGQGTEGVEYPDDYTGEVKF